MTLIKTITTQQQRSATFSAARLFCTDYIRNVLERSWWTSFQVILLDPDLEAEAVAGLTLRRLTGAGTVPFPTLMKKKRRHQNSFSSRRVQTAAAHCQGGGRYGGGDSRHQWRDISIKVQRLLRIGETLSSVCASPVVEVETWNLDRNTLDQTGTSLLLSLLYRLFLWTTWTWIGVLPCHWWWPWSSLTIFGVFCLLNQIRL